MNPGGRPSIGNEGRVSVRISESGPGDPGTSYSMLQKHARWLERIGGGNRSRGFRRLMAFVGLLDRSFDALVLAASAYQEVQDTPNENGHALNTVIDSLEGIIADGQDQDGSDPGRT